MNSDQSISADTTSVGYLYFISYLIQAKDTGEVRGRGYIEVWSSEPFSTQQAINYVKRYLGKMEEDPTEGVILLAFNTIPVHKGCKSAASQLDPPALTFEEFTHQVKAKFPTLACKESIDRKGNPIYVTTDYSVVYDIDQKKWRFFETRSSVGSGKTLEEAIANVIRDLDLYE